MAEVCSRIRCKIVLQVQEGEGRLGRRGQDSADGAARRLVLARRAQRFLVLVGPPLDAPSDLPEVLRDLLRLLR
eukprot:1163111-Alexandrium_andersonii.AAC.1